MYEYDISDFSRVRGDAVYMHMVLSIGRYDTVDPTGLDVLSGFSNLPVLHSIGFLDGIVLISCARSPMRVKCTPVGWDQHLVATDLCEFSAQRRRGTQMFRKCQSCYRKCLQSNQANAICVLLKALVTAKAFSRIPMTGIPPPLSILPPLTRRCPPPQAQTTLAVLPP